MNRGNTVFRYIFRLSGSSSQGLILAGKILAEAAAIYDGKNATRWQSYGPEARSSLSRSDVIISDEMIPYSKAVVVDLLLAFTREACDKYHEDVKKGGIILVDSGYVSDIPNGKYTIYSLPITEITEKEVGEMSVINIVALGMITESTNAISHEAMQSAILLRIPKGMDGLYLKAFGVGAYAVQKLKDARYQLRQQPLIAPMR